MISHACPGRAALLVVLLVVLVVGLVPAAGALEEREPPTDAAATAEESAAPGEAPSAAPRAVPEADDAAAPADGEAGDDSTAEDESDADTSTTDPTEAPTDAEEFPPDAGGDAAATDAQPTEEAGDPAADDSSADPNAAARQTEAAEDSADPPVEDDAVADAALASTDDEPLAQAAAAPAPEDIQVVELDAQAFCDFLGQLGDDVEGLDLSQLDGGEGLQAAPGTVLPDVDTAAYRGLLEAIDTVLAGYPDALLVNATYDGTILVVTLVPDITECEGFEDVPLPEPAATLDDVEVIVTIITKDDICAALEEAETAPAPPTDGSTGDLDELLSDLFEVRSGDQLSPDELADLTGLGEELDAVIADNPDSGLVSASYDGAILAVVLAPDPTVALECEEDTVEAAPISNPPPDTGDDTTVLAETGLDASRQAGVGVAAVLLGGLLVALARPRYRGVHAAR